MKPFSLLLIEFEFYKNYESLKDTHFLCVRAHIDVDGEVSDLHKEVFVLDAVHVVVAVKPVLHLKK